MKILRSGKKEHWEKNIFSANLSLNYICNFSCSYCINKKRRMGNEYKIHFDLHILKKFLSDILTLDKDTFHFNIAGGEPSLYKNIVDFYEILEHNDKKELISVTMATNGSQLDTIARCIEVSPNIQKNFELSMHTEQQNIDKYMKDIKNFKYPHLLIVKYLVKPNDFHNTIHVKGFINSIGAQFALHGITMHGKLLADYTDEEKKLLQKYEDDFRKNFFSDIQHNDYIEHKLFSRNDFLRHPDLSNFEGLYCTAGMSHVNITPSGKVYRCYADKENVAFSLQTQSILEYPHLTVCKPCQSVRCNCPPLTALAKWRAEVEPPYYVNQ